MTIPKYDDSYCLECHESPHNSECGYGQLAAKLEEAQTQIAVLEQALEELGY